MLMNSYTENDQISIKYTVTLYSSIVMDYAGKSLCMFWVSTYP